VLKKLVRYGNSNALVLDKAILELLNIEEGSVVKISTDGRSIILTPQTVATSLPVNETVTSGDAATSAIFKERIKKFKNFDPTREQEILSLCQERAALSMQLYKNVDLTELQKLSPLHAKDYAEYKATQNAFIQKHSPRLAQISQELDELEIQNGLGDMLKKTFEFQINNSFEMGKEFKEVFAKYQKELGDASNILNSPEYQHEAQALTEKYQNNHSTEFLKELSQLRYKLDPKLEEIDKEMDAIAKKYNKA